MSAARSAPDMLQSQHRALYDVAASSGKLCRHLARADNMQVCLGCRPGHEPRSRERFLHSVVVVIGARVFLQRRYRTCAQFGANECRAIRALSYPSYSSRNIQSLSQARAFEAKSQSYQRLAW